MSLHLDDDYEDAAPRQTELTLSTGVILGLAVALVLLCSLFFGLGYSMHHKQPGPLPVAAAAAPAAPTADFSNFKPAAGSPLHPNPTTPATPVPNTPSAPAPTLQPTPVVAKPIAAATSSPTPVAIATPNGFYVQIAAVSHQQDAQPLLDALHAKGYLVAVRTTSQDSLFHVQIGPYASHKDADLIRQKLAGEGYTAIVK